MALRVFCTGTESRLDMLPPTLAPNTGGVDVGNAGVLEYSGDDDREGSWGVGNLRLFSNRSYMAR